MTSNRLTGLRGSMVALVTPFKAGRVDEDAFIALCERQIERGSSALVPCGTTGEASTLKRGEQMRVIKLAIETARGRVPVIAGAGSNCTDTAVELVRQAEQFGADGVLCVTPYYNRPTQEGLFQHFRAIQGSTGLPVLLYDVPCRTGGGLTLDTILRLAGLGNIVGLKDAAGDLRRTVELRQQLGADFLLLSGNDGETADALAAGSQGCISVSANVAPALCAALHLAWADNDFARFQYLRDLLDILAAAMFVETNPIPVKWALARLGLIEDELRLPLTPLSLCHEAAVRHALDAIVSPEMEEAKKRRLSPPQQSAAA